jgi:hypothetical protein
MSLKRAVPLSGIAFVVFFLGSVVASSPPKDSASDRTWIANYATNAKHTGHIVTGVLLVLAALSLMVFLTHLWTTIAAARAPQQISPLPLVAAGMSAACIAVGGILMGAITFRPVPSADVLRLGNDVGFAMVGLAGMIAAALSVACLGVQARAAGVFSVRMTRFTLVVGVLLLASFAFVPIAGLLLWLIITARVLTRGDRGVTRAASADAIGA